MHLAASETWLVGTYMKLRFGDTEARVTSEKCTLIKVCPFMLLQKTWLVGTYMKLRFGDTEARVTSEKGTLIKVCLFMLKSGTLLHV